jgi:phosphoribosylformylglycinamidine synthase
VGLLEDWEKSATIGLRPGCEVIFIGASLPDKWSLGQSLWLREIHGVTEGAPPQVHLPQEKKVGEFVRRLIAEKRVSAVHDVSDGGPLVALAEMCLAGSCGAVITWEEEAPFWFAEFQASYLVALPAGSTWPDVEELASEVGIDTKALAVGQGDAIDGRVFKIPLADLRAAHEGFFPRLMGSELTPEF